MEQNGQVSKPVAARAASAARSLPVRWIAAVMDSRGVVVRVSRAAVVFCCGDGCGWLWASTALTCSMVAWAGWGEAVGLQVKHVDFERCRLSIERNLVEGGGRYEDKAPKSGKAQLVPFPRFIAQYLRVACKDKLGEASVFTHKHGGGYLKHPHSYNGWFVRALAASGIEKKITPHDLRHSAASFAWLRVRRCPWFRECWGISLRL
ncbi:hypothetical protein E4U03_06490 [Rothia nasimurium]|uniref:Tyr recombinase domain-containing protein n=1 Tax=Rothia nasimurium TaxID=85336 RepID=A0A4Y9F3E9_9MICC|nr:hypothetical protein E4U03_06490 [Rothia nasimurium]